MLQSEELGVERVAGQLIGHGSAQRRPLHVFCFGQLRQIV
jgi:hypothetical protein